MPCPYTMQTISLIDLKINKIKLMLSIIQYQFNYILFLLNNNLILHYNQPSATQTLNN